MNKNNIAPCGMNCSLCYAFQREKNKCNGCRGEIELIPNSCKRCIIRNCSVNQNNKSKFCYECESYPCQRLKQLDKRYKTKYHMSMIENLEYIKNLGINKFIENEKERWKCSECGNIICIHHNECPKCLKKHIEEKVTIE